MTARAMKPFRVYLRSEQIEPLRWLAERRKVSIAELIRQGVDRILAEVPAEEDPLWNIIGTFDSGLGNLAEKHDEYIVQALKEENR